MKAKLILRDEIADITISSLPARPTAPKSQGGMGFSSRQMKEAFDKLPLFIIERYNSLIEDVGDVGSDSLAAAIPTGIRKNHTLSSLFSDVTSGELATYLTVFGESIMSHVIRFRTDIDAVNKRLDAIEALLSVGEARPSSEQDEELSTEDSANAEQDEELSTKASANAEQDEELSAEASANAEQDEELSAEADSPIDENTEAEVIENA